MLDQNVLTVPTISEATGRRDRVDHIQTVPIVVLARSSDLSHNKERPKTRDIDGYLRTLQILAFVEPRDLMLQLSGRPPRRSDRPSQRQRHIASRIDVVDAIEIFLTVNSDF